MDLLVREGDVKRSDLVLEVGTGSGSLTAKLAAEAGHVVGVEIDSGFVLLTRATTSSFNNVTLLEGDVLKNKNQLRPDLLRRLLELLGLGPVHQLKLIANLPYVVATPVFTNLLLTNLPIERMVVTIQWELAERLAAAPGSSDYGALTVLVQSLADVELVRKMPPAAFWPRPKVDSGIVRILPNAAKRARIADLPGFHVFLRKLYLHRRKNLRGTLLPALEHALSKEEIDKRLMGANFNPAGRAEALSVTEHHRLYQLFAATP
jgi:16S rRNA (adenine1518-N6/adenine1519-N6)-dimethyltransferase